ncbi:hypothetical protein DFH06DRAFT_1206089 [Mycena polygramma]|nr:hypothetical protein DFH06DRAFT_1206089 [Mycena polygramma]
MFKRSRPCPLPLIMSDTKDQKPPADASQPAEASPEEPQQPEQPQQEELKPTPLDQVDREKLTDKQKNEYDKLLHAAVENERIGKEADKKARELEEQADEIEDDNSPERKKLLDEAAEWAKKAKEYLSISKRQQSGVWQGGVGGAGIGAGIGMGIGAFVGTLVGGILAVPTTTLGILGGAATGAIHGPWAKVTGKDRKKARGEGGDEAPAEGEAGGEEAPADGEEEKTETENQNEAGEEAKPEVGQEVKPEATST